MGLHTNIGYADSTINGTSGCVGCELFMPGHPEHATCYARLVHEHRLAAARPGLYASSFAEVRLIPGRFAQAANWKDLRGTARPDKPWLDGLPRIIFVGDLGDFLSPAVPDEYLERELLGAIQSKNGRRHFWLLLTKQPQRLAQLSLKWGGLPGHVMAMTTVTTQATADLRLPWLLKVRAKWRGISVEPMRGPIRLAKEWLREAVPYPPPCRGFRIEPAIHQVICGGESGMLARPMHPQWARDLRDQCQEEWIHFFFKQHGNWLHESQGGPWPQHTPAHQWPDGTVSYRVSDKSRRVLDGSEWSQMPAIMEAAA
ncbi:MAG: DUF5131 family protein [Opitutaceae bacterium]|nr:DUF5131 family protein [Opitutaceae bacterium]